MISQLLIGARLQKLMVQAPVGFKKYSRGSVLEAGINLKIFDYSAAGAEESSFPSCYLLENAAIR